MLLPDEQGGAADRLTASGIEVITMRLHRLRSTVNPLAHLTYAASLIPEVFGLRQVIRRRRVDIVQIAGLVNPQAALAARLEGIPVVWQLLDTRAPRFVARGAMVFVQSLADIVMSTGLSVAEAHPGYASIASRVIPFYPPVDLVRFAPRPEIRSAIREAWGIPPDALVVGCVANINPQKGIVELVHAFAAAKSAHPSARLVLIGAEYETHQAYSVDVRAQLRLEGLLEGTDVVFTGERDDVERQLAGMDVLVLAAVPRSEGITTAVLEGMAAGLPVVVTDVGGLREVVEDGRTGIVVPAGDPNAFEIALIRILGDPALRFRMSHESRHMAEQRFGLDVCAEAHAVAYSRASGARRNAN